MANNDTVLNHNITQTNLPIGQQNIQYLPDGSIEVTDTLPKKDYYKSLRRGSANMMHANNVLTLSSQMTLDGDQGKKTKSKTNKLQQSLMKYKPSGKMEICHVLMLDGVEKSFKIDHNAYGIHLFEAVCTEFDLHEVEYFGLSYRSTLRVDNWLRLDTRVSKQIEKIPWRLEFRIRFYPANMDVFQDDLTRYCLCLQLRQDIITGMLPCSFQTYAILGAYTVQSEAGDYDPENHIDIDYIANMPFAPKQLQSPQLLQIITDLHKLHKGLTPVEADRAFLENARRHALYGVEFHRVKTLNGDDLRLGVYGEGLLIYRGCLRSNRILWPQIVKIFYREKKFVLVVRVISRHTTLSKRGTLLRATSLSGLKNTLVQEYTQDELMTLTFQCTDKRLAKRLWDSCTTQHAFFRLRDSPGPKRPNLTPAFAARKYYYSNRTLDNPSRTHSMEWVAKTQPPILRTPTQRRQAYHEYAGMAPVACGEDSDQYYWIPGSPSPLPAHLINTNIFQTLPVSYRRPGPNRVPLPDDHWQMSAADCTQGLGRNIDGTDIAAMESAGWQGCRSNWGLRWPGAYFYETNVLEDGQIRLGWSTNDANLILGADNKGFGYGADDTEAGSSTNKTPTGRFIHDGLSQEYGLPVVPGDVIGCFLELNPNADEFADRFEVRWSHNGRMLPTPRYKDNEEINPDVAIFPAITLKDARVEFNFGYNKFSYPPKTSSRAGNPWQSLADIPKYLIAQNWNVGWRVNPNDMTSKINLIISPNQRMVQAVTNTGWHGFRANKGITGNFCYYYEVRIVEEYGLARVGWSFAKSSLYLGTDAWGFGYGADRDGYGINGAQGKKMNADVIENYGEALHKDDIIGCYIDLELCAVHWSKNGKMYGAGYLLDEEMIKRNEPIFPAASLVDTTLEINYGDLPFKFPPHGVWIPLFASTDENIRDSPKWVDPRYCMQPVVANDRIQYDCAPPRPPVRTSSKAFNSSLITCTSTNKRESIVEQENRSSEYKSSISKDQEDIVRSFPESGEPITTSEPKEEMNEQYVEHSEVEVVKMQHELQQVTANESDADSALVQAIMETTNLCQDNSVIAEIVDTVNSLY